jgi:hypothetical protein
MTSTNELPTKIIDISRLIAKFQANRPNNALEIVRACMEFAEGTKLPGSEKSELVKDLLTEPALVAVLPKQVVSVIDVLIQNDLVGPTIDTIVSAANGKFGLHETATCCLTALPKMLSFIPKKN